MIDINRFYLAGIICFSIIAIFSLINLVIFTYTITTFIPAAAQVIFNFVLVGFFWHLYKSQPKVTNSPVSEDDLKKEINEVFQ